MELVAEDQALAAGATPSATAGTGANTIWLMATVVLKAGSTAPPTAPAAPTGVSATAGNASATVSWTAPANGGSPITSYTITPYIGTTAQAPTTITGSPPATNATVTGLTNGTAYTFKVTATNAIGTGPDSSASNSVTPTAPTAPAAPTGVSATAGNASATVSLDRAGQRRQPDHQLHDHALHRDHRPGPDHDHRLAPGHQRHRHRADQRHRLHLQGHRHQRHRHRPRLHAPPTPSRRPPRPSSQHSCRRSPIVRRRATSLAATPAVKHHRRQPARRPGRRVGRRRDHDVQRHRRGRQHLHRGAALQGQRQHRAERVDGADHRRRRDEVQRSPPRCSARADVGVAVARVLRPVDRVSDATRRRQVEPGDGNDDHGRRPSAPAPRPPTTTSNELAVGFYVDSGFSDTLTAGSGFTGRASIFPAPRHGAVHRRRDRRARGRRRTRAWGLARTRSG